MAGAVLRQGSLPELSIRHSWKEMGKSRKGLRFVHSFVFKFGSRKGEASVWVNRRTKIVDWIMFHPSGTFDSSLAVPRGYGFGTRAHLMVLKEIAAFYPGAESYRVRHFITGVSEARAAHLKAMGLKKAISKEGMPFKEYLRKSGNYARKRFGFK